MTDSNQPPQKDAPVKTIRVGSEMFNDIKDYMVIIRKEGASGEETITRASSMHWAHGVMAAEVGFIENLNRHICGEECGHDEDDNE